MKLPTSKSFVEIDIVKGSLFLGSTIEVLKDPIIFLSKLAKNHGPAVMVNFAGKKFYVLQYPECIKHVLLDNYKQYRKGATKLLVQFLGEGLSTSNGELWLRQRRLMQPAFHKQKLTAVLNIIHEETTLFINKLGQLPPNSKINVNHELLKLTICIIIRAMFTANLGTEMNAMVNTLEELASYASSWMKRLVKIPANWPTPTNRRFRHNCLMFDKIVYGIIERRKKEMVVSNHTVYNDLLDMLLSFRDEETNAQLPNKLLRDEVTTIFMAGHETTAQTLSWILYHLADKNTISDKIRKEGVVVSGNDLLVFEDIPKLVYTRQVIQEALRCYPPIWAAIRYPLSDDAIGTLHLPAGSNVLLNIYGLHHHPAYWDEPDNFNPGHFSFEKEQQRPAYTFIPFGAGPRLCLGHNFAMMVMQVVLNRISKVFEFSVPEGYIPKVEPNITLRARGGIQLIINKIGKDDLQC